MMKKIKLFLFVCLYAINVTAQSDNKINIGTVETIDSKILGEERTVWVYVPDSGPGNIFGKTTYPVVYLLDGDSHFHSVTGMIRQLSTVNGNNLCPKMIVVGILNTNRDRDLTPTKMEGSHPYVSAERAKITGGGDKFTAFIEKELMPFIESKYPTEPYKMLIGHSFGGLTAANIFMHHTEMFNSYISIDPSMWWNDQVLLEEIKKAPLEKFNNRRFFLATANTVDDGMSLAEARMDTSFSTQHLRSILSLDDYLKTSTGESFKYQGKYYPDDDHGSVPLISTHDGIRFIFDFFQLDLGIDDMLDTDLDVYAKVVDHFKTLSKEFGREVKPGEELVNNLGYQFMGMKQYKRSERFFKLNILSYPESPNVYDSLADFYIEMDQKDKAISNLKKAVALGAQDYSKNKLAELLKE